MLSFHLVPGKSVGFFTIGMSISEAIANIELEKKHISADIKYHETEPLGNDIYIDLTENGILLCFEPTTQRLRKIEIYEPFKQAGDNRLSLNYAGYDFCSPTVEPTFAIIYKRFGPSTPGNYNSEKHLYFLHYKGVSFIFPVDSKYDSRYANSNEIPLELPDGGSPIANRIVVYSGEDFNQPLLPHINESSNYLEKVQVIVPKGLKFTKRNCWVYFGSSTQDVLSLLGPPSQVYFKQEDKLKIHSSGPYAGTSCSDYFYNYFLLGIDILFDINTHVVKKFILHTNFPCHYDFYRYIKCNFEISVEKETEFNTETSVVTADSKWEEIQEVFGPAGKPVVHTRESNVNPFGPTLFYGYKNIIFEVMSNNYIASVCLFA
eukprot:TRINITY_DN3325_c0_g1_i1.p1 TRINITY_DN3325_c0_g1~~TRINITY_DN3325_c0_g1_i1.p1  ORF type:complete len:376 (-),score=48.56 TRINITY_DN3325_c0_g1_i1:128-1255(-)